MHRLFQLFYEMSSVMHKALINKGFLRRYDRTLVCVQRCDISLQIHDYYPNIFVTFALSKNT